MTTQTRTERYLTELCRRSFLHLWSWPNVFRDQFVGKGREGKELCDLLVIFGNAVILFSDKDCAFPSSGSLPLDWSRWYRRAIKKSADQIYGAERWLSEFPDRVFLDSACKTPLPVSLPAVPTFHRVVVAHGVSAPCRTHLGGSGSLMIRPALVGDAHFTPGSPAFKPFSVGRVSESRGFVHVIDETTLDALFLALSTVEDFLQYLSRKEAFIESGMLGGAAGEEELLAYYLENADHEGRHAFPVPSGFNQLYLDEGLWESFQGSAERRAQVEADRLSYLWDKIIDRFTKHALNGTQYATTVPDVRDLEPALRLMAAESRTQRRFLSKCLFAVSDQAVIKTRAARVVPPGRPGAPHYVFLALKLPADLSYDEYRKSRMVVLHAYCLVTRLLNPEAEVVVGIATESSDSPPSAPPGRSEDLEHLPSTAWTEALATDARRLQKELDILQEVRAWRMKESEYPLGTQREMEKGRNRNQACLCGSGKKHKKCCGQRSRGQA